MSVPGDETFDSRQGMMSHLGSKITSGVAITVTICFLAMGYYYIQHQEEAILSQNEVTMKRLTESVSQGLQTIMLAGYADIARDFADRLEKIENVTDFRVVRANGYQAFLDNQTIDKVNEHKGEQEFIRREDVKRVLVIPADQPEFQEVMTGLSVVSYYDTDASGERFLTYLAPIENQEGCHDCHGSDHRIRGVLKLTTSLMAVQDEIDRTWKNSLMIFLIAILGIILLTNLIVHKTIIEPISLVTTAMQKATGGDLTSHVPVLGRDELSQMAASFNMMTEELEKTYSGLRREQNKLATIILSAQEGMVVTDSDGTVVLVNPAAERLLNKSSETIAAQGFLELLDDPEGLSHLLARDTDLKHPETVRYNDFVLSVYADTISAPDGKQLGSAALIRDITEEKRLEDRLRRLSTTDGLTGLYNRRYQDETLESELIRARRYNKELSILIFDVDYFKQFNDTHGHEKGDQILKSIAGILHDNMRNIDRPCRYGGEEFLAIMPDTDLVGARAVAERTRKQIETNMFEGMSVTVSVGVAAYPNVDAEVPTQLIAAADKALYKAKENGRNRVEVADAEIIENCIGYTI